MFNVNNIVVIFVGIAGWSSKIMCGDSQYVYLLYCWGLHDKQRLGPNELKHYLFMYRKDVPRFLRVNFMKISAFYAQQITIYIFT